MPILIEIIFFLVLGATGVWTYIKNTTRTITDGVKEKLQERERSKHISEYPIYQYANQFSEPEKYTLFGLLIILINGDTESNRLPNIRKTELLNTLASIFEVNLSVAAKAAPSLNEYVVTKDLKRRDYLRCFYICDIPNGFSRWRFYRF